MMNKGTKPEELLPALREAFTPDDLQKLLLFDIGIRLDRIVSPNEPWEQVLFEVLRTADRAGWMGQLIAAAYRARPERRDIAALYQRCGLAPQLSVQQSGLERETAPAVVDSKAVRELQAHFPSLDLGRWLEGATQVEARVCRIEAAGEPLGTGFLVGPDVVLTCYNVLNPPRRKWEFPLSAVRARFDHKVLADGTRSESLAVGLHSDPALQLIDSTPYTQAEKENRPDDKLPTHGQLDYSLIRLERPVGWEPLGSAPIGRPRGWIVVPAHPVAIKPGTPILIAHCPRGGPVQLSFDIDGVIGLNENETRVRYRVTTDYGSAGGPCFDLNWQLIAMHHYREPVPEPQYKQGIPITAIRARLERLGKADALGGESP